MRVLNTAQEMQAIEQIGQRAAVFTMGALHAGHAELIRAARKAVGSAGEVVVTIFVNPTQFNDPADLAKYPRTPNADVELCEAAGADIVFMPSVEEIYPATEYSAGAIGDLFEGASRPGHFDAVATVVARLLELTSPELTFFGEKDFQQLVVVRQLVAWLALSVEVRAVPTVRAENHLALSSRNQRLTPAGLLIAPRIYAALEIARDEILQAKPVGEAIATGVQFLIEAASIELDYFELVQENFEPVLANQPLQVGLPARLITAVYIDGVRLIDNLAVVRK